MEEIHSGCAARDRLDALMLEEPSLRFGVEAASNEFNGLSVLIVVIVFLIGQCKATTICCSFRFRCIFPESADPLTFKALSFPFPFMVTHQPLHT